MSRVWLALTALSAAGCDVSSDDFSRRYAVAVCERDLRCGDRAANALCAQQVAHPDAERVLLQVREGYATFSAANAKACLEAINSAPCDAAPTRAAPCVRISAGTLKEDAGCLPGDAWRGGCEPGLACFSAVGQYRCPRCVRVGREGESTPCDYGFDVNSYREAPTCIEMPRFGEPCRSAPVLDGDAPRLQCGPALTCGANGRCEWLVTTTKDCAADGGCTVPPVLRPLKPEGAECLSNLDCALDQCREEVCAAELAMCR